ncbi:MAG TPA: hypothetical protein VF169_24750 [Albitalea sp.]|uniref:hypothetical protein n=1 Tax=Piscinibacter sp. TaxID=1903157 RepID=UPI002ED46A7D
MRRISACALAAMLTACASAPQPASIPTDCAELHTEIARAEDARRAALDQQQSAWKAVIPFAMAARHASGKSAVADADRRLAELHAQSAQQACHPGTFDHPDQRALA